MLARAVERTARDVSRRYAFVRVARRRRRRRRRAVERSVRARANEGNGSRATHSRGKPRARARGDDGDDVDACEGTWMTWEGCRSVVDARRAMLGRISIGRGWATRARRRAGRFKRATGLTGRSLARS